FEQEYSVQPALRTVGVNNIQASISSLDIWNYLHRYAFFGTRSWGLRRSVLKHLLSNKVSRTVVGYGLRGFFDADGSVKYEIKRASRQVSRLRQFRRSEADLDSPRQNRPPTQRLQRQHRDIRQTKPLGL